MHELELRDAAHQNRVNRLLLVEPVHQIGHHDRHIVRRRRCVDYLAGDGIDHIVLDSPVLAWSSGSPAHAIDEPFVDFPDQPLRDRTTVFDILGNELKGLLIVQQLQNIVAIGPGHQLAFQESTGLIQGQASSFYVRGVMGFKNQRTASHLIHPGLGQSRGIQEPTGPLNASQASGNPVGDREHGIESPGHSASPPFPVQLVDPGSYTAPFGDEVDGNHKSGSTWTLISNRQRLSYGAPSTGALGTSAVVSFTTPATCLASWIALSAAPIRSSRKPSRCAQGTGDRGASEARAAGSNCSASSARTVATLSTPPECWG
ncbi:MAG: hypothetical protein BWX47_02082 [candidate division Hyd24-12 bacterium ADurb.Bin004]|nr:MAG: hypothetical protein BWX47_02082 [candidate division Hyd24-12 bacterium ADurb.Bin004]